MGDDESFVIGFKKYLILHNAGKIVDPLIYYFAREFLLKNALKAERC